jgi:hypothetical protein
MITEQVEVEDAAVRAFLLASTLDTMVFSSSSPVALLLLLLPALPADLLLLLAEASRERWNQAKTGESLLRSAAPRGVSTVRSAHATHSCANESKEVGAVEEEKDDIDTDARQQETAASSTLEVSDGMVVVVASRSELALFFWRRGSDHVRSGRWSSFLRTRSHSIIVRTPLLILERREELAEEEEEEEVDSMSSSSSSALFAVSSNSLDRREVMATEREREALLSAASSTAEEDARRRDGRR